jgi:multiple sugar transport system ATP-binding protein
MAQIRVENLRKSFDQFTAVQGSNFTIGDGTFFAMLGPSGCGKTTTLRMIAGLELPTDGRILLDGEDVTYSRAAARDIAFVFQFFALYPHMNVSDNIGFPLKCQGMARREIAERVAETARLLRIEHLLKSKTSGLSGGDRQRVALGRAMVRRPKAFLMDEPLGALDAEFRHLMCRELRDLHDRIGATTIYVTHDQLEAMSMADRIAIMNGGRVEQIGSPQEVYDHPASLFVADFIGSPPMNFLRFEGSLQSGRRSRQFPWHPYCGAGDTRTSRVGPAGAWCSPGAYPLFRRGGAARQRVRRRVSRHHADRDRRYRLWPRGGAIAVEHAGPDRRDGRSRLSSRAAVAVRCAERSCNPHREP